MAAIPKRKNKKKNKLIPVKTNELQDSSCLDPDSLPEPAFPKRYGSEEIALDYRWQACTRSCFALAYLLCHLGFSVSDMAVTELLGNFSGAFFGFLVAANAWVAIVGIVYACYANSYEHSPPVAKRFTCFNRTVFFVNLILGLAGALAIENDIYLQKLTGLEGVELSFEE